MRTPTAPRVMPPRVRKTGNAGREIGSRRVRAAIPDAMSPPSRAVRFPKRDPVQG